MFDLTDDEKEALERAQALADDYGERHRAALRLGSYAPDEDRAAAKQATQDAKQKHDVFVQDETYLLASLKSEINKIITEKLPGGSYSTIITLAEQVLPLIPTGNGKRTLDLVRSVALMVLSAGADTEIHLARARILKARYDSLIEVGLPGDLVHQILVAEASRPWPALSTKSGNR